MFERRHYCAIAEVFKQTKPTLMSWEDERKTAKIEQWEECVEVMAKILASDNPNFQRSKFLKACYY